MVRRVVGTMTAFATAAFWTVALAAQGDAARDAFEALPGGRDPNQEVLAASPLVFYAYSFVWIALLVYVLSLWRRIARVERELHEVAARIQSSKTR